ncbi:MAG TPA: peptide ligase PGM1-related protein [Chthoniobacterales bacterium]|nr:peptide ligase PGM1-related protein [Chthoniobacterales bacterium]
MFFRPASLDQSLGIWASECGTLAKSLPQVQDEEIEILLAALLLKRQNREPFCMHRDPHLIGLPPDVTAEEAADKFDRLQKKLVPLWSSIERFNQDEQTIVVVPSISLEMAVSGFEVQGYEERFLFLLFLLAQPRANLIYVTSQAIHPSVIEYYLGLLPGVIRSHAVRRLTLLSPYDDTARPLSIKLLERPRLLERIVAGIKDKDRAHLVCYNTTYLERNLALRLGIPLYGADPRHFPFGTKTGCRQLFARAGINHPLGFDNLSSIEEATSALVRLKRQRPSVRQAIVKLNEGVAGEGNALVDLTNLAEPTETAMAERVEAMGFEKADIHFEEYAKNFRERGGVVEERVGVGAAEVRSPSVQLRVTPLGKVELLSTHDQVLGGPSGQKYLGCTFPADPAYASAITRDAAKVGELLRDVGVIGRFAIDFVVTREQEGGPWNTYAIEVNLRKGGTTHPFLTLQFLTGGNYDPENAIFTAPNGRQKFLVASDHLESPVYRGYTPDDLFDLVIRSGLHFGQSRQTGIVFHMMSALGSCGRLGLTAVGNSPEEARRIFDEAERLLNEEARFDELGAH